VTQENAKVETYYYNVKIDLQWFVGGVLFTGTMAMNVWNESSGIDATSRQTKQSDCDGVKPENQPTPH